MKIKSTKINVVVNFMQFSLLLCYRKNVGPVKFLQDQQLLGVTGPTGLVSFWVSVEAWVTLSTIFKSCREETRIPSKNHPPTASYWQLSHMPKSGLGPRHFVLAKLATTSITVKHNGSVSLTAWYDTREGVTCTEMWISYSWKAAWSVSLTEPHPKASQTAL